MTNQSGALRVGQCGLRQPVKNRPQTTAITLTPPIYRRVIGVLLGHDQRGIDGVGVERRLSWQRFQRTGRRRLQFAPGIKWCLIHQPSQPEPARGV